MGDGKARTAAHPFPLVSIFPAAVGRQRRERRVFCLSCGQFVAPSPASEDRCDFCRINSATTIDDAIHIGAIELLTRAR